MGAASMLARRVGASQLVVTATTKRASAHVGWHHSRLSSASSEQLVGGGGCRVA